MNFNLKQLEAFVWVAELGSFRKVAQKLNTTQPNISARVSGLESGLKTTLFNRGSGPVSLTKSGENLLPQARAVLEACRKLADAADPNAKFEGILRLGVTELVAHTWLREFLRTLKERFPNLVVELTIDLSVNLSSELFSRSIDLAFQNGPFERQASGEIPLGTYRWIWVASPSLGIDPEAIHSADSLLRFPVLTHARDTIPHRQLTQFFSSNATRPSRLVPSSNLATCINMTIDGLGVASLPAAMVKRELEDGELIELRCDWAPQSMEFHARFDSTKAPKFVEAIARIGAESASIDAE